MRQYITRRVLQMIPILLGLSIIIFGLFALAPGDFIDANLSKNLSAEKVAELKALYGFDQPPHTNFLSQLHQ